jgi:WD40 repeat protein
MKVRNILVIVICLLLVNSNHPVFAENDNFNQGWQKIIDSQEKTYTENYSYKYNPDKIAMTSEEEISAFPPTEVITLKNSATIKKIGQLLKAPVFSIRFIPQKNLMILGTSGGIYLYDATTYEEKTFYDFPHMDSLEISADGNSLILGRIFRDRKAVVLSIPELTSIREFISVDPDSRKNLTFSTSGSISPDGKIAAVSEGGTNLFDIGSGNYVANFKTSKQKDSYSSFSPDGKTLTTYGISYLNLWNLPESKWVATISDAYGFKSVSYSPDGKYLAAGCLSGKIMIINPQTGKIYASLSKHQYGISSLQFSNDSKYLIAGTLDKSASLWDTSKWSLIHEFKMASSVYAVAITPDNSTIITASALKENEEQELIFWNITDYSVQKIIPGFTGPANGLDEKYSYVRSITFSQDNRYFAALSEDQVARIWETSGGKNILNIKLTNHENNLSMILFSPDGKFLYIGNEFYSFPDGVLIRKLPYQVRKSALSKDGNLFVSFDTTGEINNQIRIWDISKSKLLKSIPVSGYVYDLGLSNDSTMVAIDNYDLGTKKDRICIKVFNTGTGKQLYRLNSFYPTSSITFDSKDETIIIGSLGGAGIRKTLHNFDTVKYSFSEKDSRNWVGEAKMRISPNKDFVVGGSHIYSLQTGSEYSNLPIDGRYVYDVAISPDSKYIATSTINGEVFIWGIKSE